MIEPNRPMRPMGIGDILDETVKLFGNNFARFVTIIAILQVPMLVLQMVVSRLTRAIPTPDFDPTSFWLDPDFVVTFALWGTAILAFVIVAGVMYMLMAAALTFSVSERYLGRSSDPGRSYAAALGAFWRLLGAGLLAFLIFVAGSAIAVAVTGLLATVMGIAARNVDGLPVVVTILGGLIMLAWFVVSAYFGLGCSLIVPAAVVEGRGPWGCVARSLSLIRWNWWRAFALLFLAIAAQTLLAWIPSAIVAGVVTFVGLLAAPQWSDVFLLVGEVIGGLLGIIAAPISLIVITLLYYDLRIRKEGFDLQLLADQLGQ